MSSDGELPPPPYGGEEPDVVEGPGLGQPAPSRGLLLGAGVAAAVLVAGVAGFLWVTSRGNDPGGVVERFVKAYDNRQCDKAVGYWHLEGRERDSFREECEDSADGFDTSSFQILDVSDRPGPEVPRGASRAAEVRIELGLEEDGETVLRRVTLLVAEFDGAWLIIGDS